MAKKSILPSVDFGLTNHEVKSLLQFVASEILDNNIVCQDYSMNQEPENLKERQPRRIAVRANTGKLSVNLEVVYRLSSYI